MKDKSTRSRDEKQRIVVVTKSDQINHDLRNCLQGMHVTTSFYDDPKHLLTSFDFRRADVFVVSVNLGDYDGRNLYLEQKNRLRIVPFLFLIDRPVTDEDWDGYSVVYSTDLFDYLEIPYSLKKLKHRIKLMLTITNMYNIHTLDTIEGLRIFWRESIIKDREMLRRMKAIYGKEK